jgi:hypothetical protein
LRVLSTNVLVLRFSSAALLTCAVLSPRAAEGQAMDSAVVSILYTGRTFGALGVRRAQDEHSLLTEQANAEGAPFKLVSHLAWRVPGIVVFLPGQEPLGDEIEFAVSARHEAERIDTVRALVSANVILLQDPWRPDPDLIAMVNRNPRRHLDFPDLVPTTVTVSRLRSPRDQRIVIVEQHGAEWPAEISAWRTGELNRIDVLDSRVFELPLNLGEIGPRATVLRQMRESNGTTAFIIADLGHQQGDLGVNAQQRARLDFGALHWLGYTLSVPYEFELSLGADSLSSIREAFPSIQFLAANVRARDTTLFRGSSIVEAGGVRLGFVGLVNSTIRYRLPRERLLDFTFEPPVEAARREIALLRSEGADAIVVLSNMDAADNAMLAERVVGFEAILADFPVRWAPEIARTRVELPDRPTARPGAPVLIARSAANGVAVGRLDLVFRRSDRPYVTAATHTLTPVTDNIAADTTLVSRITAVAAIFAHERGDLMFPAFVDLATRHPALAAFDATTAQGRVSKGMWEAFMARLLRMRARAEVAVIRRLDQFPPLIGKLHENEIREWLWTEDQIVVLDVLGSELRALLRGDVRGELATSGYDPVTGTVQGHRLDDQTYYRVATVDVLFEGARSLSGGRRVRRAFTVDPAGELVTNRHARPLALKEFVFGELKRIRSQARGDEYLDRIAELIAPDLPYRNLLAFTFDRPTLWASMNQVSNRDGYGSVAESRITASDSWIAGLSGRFIVSHEWFRNGTDLGIGFAYGRQGVRTGGGNHVGESSDDLKFDITFRPSARAGQLGRRHLFVRGLMDTEFTPTIDPRTKERNPHQRIMRGSGGFMLLPGQYWRRVELALALENDLARPNLQYGVQSAAYLVVPIGILGAVRGPRPTYRLQSDVTYLMPTSRDGPSNLALRYGMLHEVLIPLVDELSLSVAADLFFFRGKVPETRQLGRSTQLRIGVTYDRLWKPRYQPFL